MSSEIIRPTGAGTNTNLGVTAGYSNWEAVAEDPHDDTASVVSKAWAGSEEFPTSGSAIDTYVCADPVLRDGTIRNVSVTLVSKVSTAAGSTVSTLPYVLSGGTGAYRHVAYPQTSYEAKTGRFSRDPNTGSPWTFAGVDAAEFGIYMAAAGCSVSTNASVTQLFATVNVFSPWTRAINAQHTFLRDADCAFTEYLTNVDMSPTSVDRCATMLAQYDFECTPRAPWLYGDAMFPRIHVFTQTGRTRQVETSSHHAEFTTALTVWANDTDPNVSASKCAEILGAITSLLEQISSAISNVVSGGQEAPDLRRFYANWGNFGLKVSGPRFHEDDDMAGLCSGVVEATWWHVDPE